MKIPTVDYCCCVVSLRIATLLIGIFSVIGALCSIKNTLTWYYEVEGVMNHPEAKGRYAVTIREHLLLFQIFVNLDFLLTASSVVLSTVLLAGFFYNSRTMIRAWVIGSTGVQMLAFVFNCLMSYMFSEVIYLAYNITIFLNLYFACVVNSYAQEIIKPVTFE